MLTKSLLRVRGHSTNHGRRFQVHDVCKNIGLEVLSAFKERELPFVEFAAVLVR